MRGARAVALFAPLGVALVVGACGGRTVGLPTGLEPVGTGSIDGGSAGSSSGTGSSTGGSSGSGECVTIEASSFDTSCAQDSDCVSIETGAVCTGQCGCGGTPINASGLARYDMEIAGIAFADCPCVSPGILRCIANQCTTCGFGPNEPAGCSVGGADSGAPDSGVIGPTDAGPPPECVDVDLASFDASCTQASDCIPIQSGEVCQGQCACTGSAINVSGKAAYHQLVSGITFGTCHCLGLPPPDCLGGMCVQCGNPNDPVECHAK